MAEEVAAGGGAGGTTGVLEDTVGGGGGAGTSDGPSTAGGGEPSRGSGFVPVAGGGEPGTRCDLIYDVAGRLSGAAGAVQRTTGYCGGYGRGQPQPAGDGRADWI